MLLKDWCKVFSVVVLVTSSDDKVVRDTPGNSESRYDHDDRVFDHIVCSPEPQLRHMTTCLLLAVGPPFFLTCSKQCIGHASVCMMFQLPSKIKRGVPVRP